ncbi:MAG: ATP-binding protein, partial [Chloroflexi bacterium]|nr:ATP-binding protein [Chloroflexota bacterium]
GLKDLYPSRVELFTLDAASTQRRGGRHDYEVEIGFDQIEPEDIAMLQDSMGLSQPMVESVYRLYNKYGENWLSEFAEADVDEIASALGLNAGTLQPLRRKLDRYLFDLDFVKPRAADDSVRRILESLRLGKSVVLEFGAYSSSLHAYILVANILSRHIYDAYRKQKELALSGRAEAPRQLVITIEEAHKFLNPGVANLTIFGTIAREMRKYNATLLVVDQRPSSIADEVMSQIGTRITCLLDDEKDIAAVLTGISGATSLRGVLARLDSKQQALILGHAVPMPVVVQTRDFGPETYGEFQYMERADGESKTMRDVRKDFFGL